MRKLISVPIITGILFSAGKKEKIYMIGVTDAEGGFVTHKIFIQ